MSEEGLLLHSFEWVMGPVSSSCHGITTVGPQHFENCLTGTFSYVSTVSLAPFSKSTLSQGHLPLCDIHTYTHTQPRNFQSLFVNKIWIDPTWLVGGKNLVDFFLHMTSAFPRHSCRTSLQCTQGAHQFPIFFFALPCSCTQQPVILIAVYPFATASCTSKFQQQTLLINWSNHPLLL